MHGKLTIGVLGVVIGVLLSTVVVALAGNPSGPDLPPDEGYSYTLVDISNSLLTGADATPMAFTEPVAGPGTGTMLTMQELYASTRIRAFVPRTGQGVSYRIPDDGYLQKGVVWPSPRFTDNNDGTITDNLTRLIWLENANCFGAQAWNDALAAATTLNSTECGLSDGSAEGNWRLPNVRELQSLIDYGRSMPALSGSYPFDGVQSAYYWSSTTRADNSSSAWGLDLADGGTDGVAKTSVYYVWPVRGGR